ncbi:MAG: hypothetical protein Q8R24_06210 [Legionellaceae bacterium]|nr:hypothetical protein [Legionellaceae bacterium]
MQNIDEKVIERFDGARFEDVRAQIKVTIEQAREYNATQSERTFDIATHLDIITQLATERLDNLVGRALSGDILIDPTKLDGLSSNERSHLERLSHIIFEVLSHALDLSKSIYVEQIISTLSQSEHDDVLLTLLAKWQNKLNAKTTEEIYQQLEKKLDTTTRAELVITLGVPGAYSGGNTNSISSIEPQNQFDLIVRAGLEQFAGCPPGDDKIVYVQSANAIWVGCVAIDEIIQSNQAVFDYKHLTEALRCAWETYHKHSGASIVLNTRCTTMTPDKSADIGHFESFVLSPDPSIRGQFNLFHKNSQGVGTYSQEYRDPSVVMVIAAANDAGFGVVNYHPVPSRYNQNSLSCGPSAVAETLDYLLGLDASRDRFDYFLKKPDEPNRQRRFNDRSRIFTEANAQTLLQREDVMRLAQLFLIAENLKNQWMQFVVAADPELFKCYIRDCDDQHIVFPVPSILLRKYSEVAYPSEEARKVARLLVAKKDYDLSPSLLFGNIVTSDRKIWFYVFILCGRYCGEYRFQCACW